MKSTVSLLIFFILPIFSTQINIYNDDDPKGLEFVELNSVYVHEITKHLYYTYNLTSIQRLFSWNRMMAMNCYMNVTKLSALEIEIERNVKWRTNRPEPKTENVTRINETLYPDRILSAVIDKFDQNIDNCETLDTLTKSFARMNQELNNLARLNTTEIDKIVLPEKTVDIINSMLEDKYSLPYTLNYTNAKEFLRHSEFDFFSENDQITLAFKIPMYTKTLLYKIYPKPILKKDTPHILLSNEKYAIFINQIPIFYNKNNFYELCYVRANTHYCAKPVGSWKCEREMTNSTKYRKSCLEKLPKQNIITRIKDTIFLTIVKPIQILVDCKSSKYLIITRNNSMLTIEQNCQLNSSSYVYNPNEQNNLYDLHILNETHPPNDLFFNYDTFNRVFTFCYFIFLILTYLILLAVGIIIESRKLKKLDELGTESATHEYEVIDGYI